MINYQTEAKKHNNRLKSYTQEIKRLFKEADAQLVALAFRGRDSGNGVFRFSNSITLNIQADAILTALKRDITTEIQAAAIDEAENANAVILALLASMPDAIKNYPAFNQNNHEQIRQYVTREIDGKTIADRVSDYVEQYKSAVELVINEGMQNDTPQSTVANKLDYYLTNPMPLYGRTEKVIDGKNLTLAAGAYVLGQSARVLRPGSGYERSAYRNIARMSADEIRGAYRLAMLTAFRQVSVIVGYRTVINPFSDVCPICEALNGATYNKDFVWYGYHPRCACRIEPIWATQEEIDETNQRIERGEQPLPETASKNYVSKLDPKVSNWIKDNKEKLSRTVERGTTPYWLRNNTAFIDPKMYSK